MTEAQAIELILQHWESGWEALHPAFASDPDHVPWTPDDETFDSVASWVRVSVSEPSSKQITMGEAPNRKFERRGFVSVQIFTLPNAGSQSRSRLADDVRTVLEGKSIGTTPRITTYDGTGMPPSSNAAWSMGGVVVPYRYVETK